MATHGTTFEIPAPIHDVFDVLLDVGGWRDWDPSIRTVVARDEGPPQVGSTYDVTVGFYGKAIEQVHEIVEVAEPTRLAVGSTGRAVGRWEFTLDPTETGTRVRWTVALSMKGFARLLDRGLDLALSGLVDNAVDGLEKRFT